MSPPSYDQHQQAPVKAKVYLCEFTHRSGKKFYKFGHTRHMDVLKRFSTEYGSRYGEFSIKCVASIVGDLEWCVGVEESFKAMFPKNIWLEDYLGEGSWGNFSGITEIVVLSQTEYDRARVAFYNVKKNQDKRNKRAV